MNGFNHPEPDRQVVRASGTKDLDAQRDAITKLYWEEDRDREVVMGIMESQYNFKATERQYKDAFKRWGLRKNATNSDMKHMIRIRKRRLEEDGKKTEFSLFKRRVPDAKIDRFVQRTGFEARMMMSEALVTGETPPAIDYKTPSECNSVAVTPQAVADAISNPPSPALGLEDMASLTLEGLGHSTTSNIGNSQLSYPSIEFSAGGKRVAMPSNIALESLGMTNMVCPDDGLVTIPEHQVHGAHTQASRSVGIPGGTDKVSERDELNVTVIMDEQSRQLPDDSRSNGSMKKANESEDPSISNQESVLPDVIEVNRYQGTKHHESSHGGREDLLIINKELFEHSATTRSLHQLSQPLDDEALGSYLRAAASRGDRATVQKILGTSTRVVDQRVSWGGRTALHNAAFAGHCDIMQDLLQAGADPYLAWFDGYATRRGTYYYTALKLAILADQVDAVEMIVSSVCTTDSLHWSYSSTRLIDDAAIYAMEKERQTCLKTLVSCICQKKSDFAWNNIVCLAVEHFHFEGLRILLEHKIDINLPSAEDQPYPLTLAVSSTNPLSLDMVEFLADNGADLNREDEFETPQDYFARATPLSFSVSNPSMTRTLLKLGAQPNLKSKGGLAPLHIAAMTKDGESAARVLLDSGADPNIHDHEGSTPLHWVAASICFNQVFLRMLMQAGGFSDTCGEFPDSSASYSLLQSVGVSEPHRRGEQLGTLIKLFVLAGANLNTQNCFGQTPLHILIQSSKADDYIDLFLESGADPKIRNREGETPLHLAILNWQNLSCDVLRTLLESDSGVVHQKRHGQSPLCLLLYCLLDSPGWLVDSHFLNLVLTLLDFGANRRDVKRASLPNLDYIIRRAFLYDIQGRQRCEQCQLSRSMMTELNFDKMEQK